MMKDDVRAAVQLWWKHREDEAAFLKALVEAGLAYPGETIGTMADGFDGSPAERVVAALDIIDKTGCCTRQGLRSIRDALVGP